MQKKFILCGPKMWFVWPPNVFWLWPEMSNRGTEKNKKVDKRAKIKLLLSLHIMEVLY